MSLVRKRFENVFGKCNPALRRSRKSKKSDDWSSYKRLQNACNNKVQQAKQKYHRNNLSEIVNNTKKFWKIIKDIIPSKPASNTSMSQSEKKRKADLFCEYFSSVVSGLAAIPLTKFIWWKLLGIFLRTTNRFQMNYVSKIYIEKELKTLKRNKSAGLDTLTTWFVKGLCGEYFETNMFYN